MKHTAGKGTPRRKRAGWFWGAWIGLGILLSGAVLIAWQISRGTLAPDQTPLIRWILLCAAMCVGCVGAGRICNSKRLLHTALTALILLGSLLLGGRLLGVEAYTGLPYAAGIAAGAALLGVVLGGKRGTKYHY